MTKTVFIKSYGCQMNVYDAGRMRDVLAPLGYEQTERAEGADLLIFNTCHIREKADEKLFSDLGRYKSLKARASRPVIAVAGCIAQAEGGEIARRAPYVDLVFGPQTYHRLPDMLARLEAGEAPVVDTEFPIEDKFDRMPTAPVSPRPSAFLTVQEGCDKFCTFCVVPYTRGAEASRSVASIAAEARALAAAGVREITLLGQNVNAYRGAGPDGTRWSLARLIRHLGRIDGLDRLRYTTSHPCDMSDDLIEEHAANEKLMPYLHLPVQAGSNRILAAMNRQYTVQAYLDLVARIRAARSDIALSGDFIVGFPGETEEDFRATLDLVRSARYASAFSFKYSPRPGTPAAAAEQIADEVKTERLSRLQALLGEEQRAFNRRQVGRRLPVLFEKPGRHAGQMVGRSPYLQAVHAEAEGIRSGEIHEVEIIGAETVSLAGRLVRGQRTAAE